MKSLRSVALPRPGRPRISTGIHESKTLALYNAGRGLLARHDHEAFSVAELAKLGRCSVGTFYVRFRDKTAFLSFVIRESFSFSARSLAAKGGIKAVGTTAKARLAASLLTDQFADAEFAGILRAAVKLGFSEPYIRAPLDDYRQAATDQLSAWLAEGRTKQDAHIRAALQIILGTLTDAALSQEGTKALKSGRFQNAFVYLLESAVSGDLKTPSKIATGKPAPKPGPQKSNPPSSRSIRKI